MASAYRSDYPNEPIGGDNPYYRCVRCKRSDPEINGDVEGHYEWCGWRKEQERLAGAANHEVDEREKTNRREDW